MSGVCACGKEINDNQLLAGWQTCGGCVVTDPKGSTTPNDLTQALYEQVMRQREAIVTAFIAETGLKPSECEQVQQGDRWFVRKRQEWPEALYEEDEVKE